MKGDTQVTDPNGNVSYVVCNDPNHEERVYAGWNAATGMPTGYKDLNHSQVVRSDDVLNDFLKQLADAAVPLKKK